jgi:hypothetical protein
MRRWQAIQVSAVGYVALAMLALLVAGDAAEGGKRGRAEKPASSPLPDDVLHYMPAGCQTFAWIDAPKLRQHGVIGGELAEGVVIPEQADRIAIGWTGVPAIMIADKRIGDDNFVAVITLRQPVPATELRTKLTKRPEVWYEETVAGVTLKVLTSQKLAFMMPAKQTVILGRPQVIREVLTRGEPAKFSEKLARACERLDRSQAIALALAAPDVFASFVFLPAEMRKGVETVSFYYDVNQAGSQVRLAVQCDDRSIADQLQGVLRVCQQLIPFLGVQPPEAYAFLASLDCTVDDRSVVVRGGFPMGLLATAIAPFPGSASVSGYGVSSGRSLPPGAPVPLAAPWVVACKEVPSPTSSAESQPSDYSPYYAKTVVPPPLPPAYTAPSSPSGYAPGATAYRPGTSSYESAPLWKPLPPASPAVYERGPQPPAAANEAAKRLGQRCEELERRLRLAEQDRDLLAQRVELYRKQVEEYRQQLDRYLEEPSHVRPAEGSPVK